jgi:anti-sigma-K factor RskA
MSAQHEEIEELVSVASLGGLDAGDLAHLEELMAAHGPDCSECARLRDGYREAAGRLAFAVAPDEAPAGMEDRLVRLAVGPSRRSRLQRYVAGVAAAALIVVGGLGGYALRGGAASSRVIHLGSSNGIGAMALLYEPDRTSYLIGSGLARLPDDRVYELWAMHGPTPVPAGAFNATQAQVIVAVRSNLTGADHVAVTVERAPGVQVPTTRPIFTAPITQ